jgi:hypothetical protein
MSESPQHPPLRPHWLNSYLAYSVACAMVWALIWIIVAVVDPKGTINRIAFVFGGWVIGWLSATIARLVYPPPNKRPGVGPRSFFQGYRET